MHDHVVESAFGSENLVLLFLPFFVWSFLVLFMLVNRLMVHSLIRWKVFWFSSIMDVFEMYIDLFDIQQFHFHGTSLQFLLVVKENYGSLNHNIDDKQLRTWGVFVSHYPHQIHLYYPSVCKCLFSRQNENLK